MAELWEGERHAVCCGGAPGITVLRVKLTETALRALEDYRDCQDSVSSQPSIQFQGYQGLIRVPKVDVPNEVQTFIFYTSDAGNDNPQGSFECVQQTHSSSGASQLRCLGPVQSQVTVCPTSASVQTTRQRVSQAEEEWRSRSAKGIKPGRPLLGKKPAVRKPRKSTPDPVPERKRSTPLNPALALRKTHTPNPVAQRPYRERVMHLLALRSYKKPELLARLQKDGVSQKDKNCLGSILQQVANLNPKDNSYSLKDYLFKDIKTDWPGYTEIDKQSLKLKRSNLILSQNATRTGHQDFPLTSGTDGPSTSQKQPLNSDFINPFNKKPRISHLASRTHPLHSGQFSASSERAAAAAPPPLAATTFPAPPSQCPTFLSTFSPMQAASSSSPSNPEGQRTQDLKADCSSHRCQSLLENQQHKQTSPTAWGPSVPAAKCPPQSAEEKPGVLDTTGAEEEGAPKETKTGQRENSSSWKPDEGAEDPCTASTDPSSASEQPDYILKYTAIESYRQRESYEEDFNAEYGEYRALHAGVESVIQRFRQLEAQYRLLSAGTKEYQVLQEEILGEYRMIKQSTPSYSQQKSRCKYLHNKLAHIKRLIEEFDQHQGELWHQSLKKD